MNKEYIAWWIVGLPFLLLVVAIGVAAITLLIEAPWYIILFVGIWIGLTATGHNQ